MKNTVWSIAAACFIFFGVAQGQTKKYPTARPVYSVEFIVAKILELKKLPQQPEVPLPQILFASEVKLKDFQDDVEPQWGQRPAEVTNVFVAHANKIYLGDEKKYYDDHQRCIDDSLAHELAHFVQVKHRGWDLNDESLEWDAVDTQTWFRDQYCPDGVLP